MGDYLLYRLLQAAALAVKVVPLKTSLFAARAVGFVYYYIAGRKNRLALANLKIAFPQKSASDRKLILRKMYRLFAQNAVETLYLPRMDEHFMRQHVSMPRYEVVEEALRLGRGIIFLGCHAGSWEVSNAACALFFEEQGYAMLAQPQGRTRRVDELLNCLRESRGSQVIRVDALKKVIAHLAGNHILGSIADHGGKDGVPVPFFGKPAMTPVGSIKLAQKLGARIVLSFMHRDRGPLHELLFERFDPVVTGREKDDVETNLRRINAVFEAWLARYPEEYLWTYKRWKYSPQKTVCVLSDAKAGHVKQSLALAGMIKDMGFEVKTDVMEVVFRGLWMRCLMSLVARCCGARAALMFLGVSLASGVRGKLLRSHYDVVVSSGSSLAAVNLAVARENSARSFVVMKPGILSSRAFDLVFVPEHDRYPAEKNVVPVPGALCRVTPEAMKEGFEKLAGRFPFLKDEAFFSGPRLGVLIGGDSKYYAFTADMVSTLCGQINKFLDETGGRLYLTTSRRTPEAVLQGLEGALRHDPRCRLFVAASEENPAGTVEGILHLSDVLVVSGESISMVSEAMASGKPVVVFEPRPTVSPNKVQRFLKVCAEKKYNYSVDLNEIYGKLSWIIKTKPAPLSAGAVRQRIEEALRKIL